MSTIGLQNFRSRPDVADAVARSVLLGREDELFFADEGAPVMTPEQAYALGRNGGGDLLVKFRRQGRRWVRLQQPMAVSLDCIKPLEAGLELFVKEEGEASQAYLHDFCDTPWCDEDYGPQHSVTAAFFEVECERSRQAWEMWQLHELGGVAAEDVPVWLVRVRAAV